MLRDLAREGHHTVLLVTHNSAIARMADRVVRLHSGAIASDERVDASGRSRGARVVSGVLARKLRRDVWRQRTQFLAVVVVVAIGIAVFVAASDAYRNLKDSFATAYATQRLPDVVLSGPNADTVAERRGAPARRTVCHARVPSRIRARASRTTRSCRAS